MRNPLHELYDRANHEAGHACAHHRFGRPIKEVSIEHDHYWSKEHGRIVFTGGQVVPGEVEPPPIPPGLDADEILQWADHIHFKAMYEIAVAARIGGLFGAHDWHGPWCVQDRWIVLEACPRTFKADVWEMFVEEGARAIFDDARYVHAHRVLAGDLLEHRTMSGDAAFKVLDQALAEYDRGHGR